MKYLGVLLDNNLSFKPRIAHLEYKISHSVGVIAKLRYYLPSHTFLNLYFALVHSHLRYGLLVWAFTYITYETKLKKLRSKAIKIIANICPGEKVTPHYYRLKILKLDDLYQFELAKLKCQFILNKLLSRYCNYFTYSSDFHSYSTRNSFENNLRLPRFSTVTTQKSFKYVGTKLWNNIPHNITQLSLPNLKSLTNICS